MMFYYHKSSDPEHKTEISGLGDVIFKANGRIRHLRMRLTSDTDAIIEYPRKFGYRKAFGFVIANVEWFIRRKRALLKRYSSEIRIHRSATGLRHDQIQKVIKERVAYLAAVHGFTLNGLSIRNQKTRWGSCSSKNVINLNINLIRLPGHLMDYVILHEMVHLHVKNHGHNFWTELEKYVPGAKNLDSELKKYRLVD